MRGFENLKVSYTILDLVVEMILDKTLEMTFSCSHNACDGVGREGASLHKLSQ